MANFTINDEDEMLGADDMTDIADIPLHAKGNSELSQLGANQCDVPCPVEMKVFMQEVLE